MVLAVLLGIGAAKVVWVRHVSKRKVNCEPKYHDRRKQVERLGIGYGFVISIAVSGAGSTPGAGDVTSIHVVYPLTSGT